MVVVILYQIVAYLKFVELVISAMTGHTTLSLVVCGLPSLGNELQLTSPVILTVEVDVRMCSWKLVMTNLPF